MPTKNPKIQAYLKPSTYALFEHYKRTWKLNNSQALNSIIDSFITIETEPEPELESIIELRQRIAQLEGVWREIDDEVFELRKMISEYPINTHPVEVPPASESIQSTTSETGIYPGDSIQSTQSTLSSEYPLNTPPVEVPPPSKSKVKPVNSKELQTILGLSATQLRNKINNLDIEKLGWQAVKKGKAYEFFPIEPK